MNGLNHIKDAPVEQGRYWLVVKSDTGEMGAIPLMLDGSEEQKIAARRFDDACAAMRAELAREGGWNPCAMHVDGRPRTEYELACDAFLTKVGQVGWDNVADLPEHQRMMALRPAPTEHGD